MTQLDKALVPSLIYAPVFTAFTSIPIPFAAHVVSAHETGHLIAAEDLNLNPELKFILPLGIINIGKVQVNKTQDPATKAAVKLAGPICGIAASLGASLFCMLLGSPLAAGACLAITATEIFNALIGTDSILRSK